MKKSNQHLIIYLLSFTTPLLIMACVLALQDIYLGSKHTILASDGFHQYVIFSQTLHDILHGHDSLFYTFTSGLGLNFYALISYYLGSFLSPFVYFFSNKQMADAIYLLTLIKFGLIGLSTCYSLKQLYQKIPSALLISLSTTYALMSFATSQLEINMWLDVFMLAPLILLGLHQLVHQNKITLYYISLSLLFIQNYYFGFMMSIFLLLYTSVQLTSLDSWKKIRVACVTFLSTSCLAGLSSAVMLLPTYLDLKSHGEKLTPFKEPFTEGSWYLDSFAKLLVGAFDTTKFGSIPMIYVGIFPLLLALAFFLLPTVKWKTRIAYALLITFFIASFYLQPLDLFWQGLHAPNMFLHRYSWLLSLLILFMAGNVLDDFHALNWKHLLPSFASLIIGFIATYFFKKQYPFLESIHFLLSAAFLLAYAILLFCYCLKQVPTRLFIGFTLLFTLSESFLNTYYQVDGIKEEWVFPTREGFEKHMDDLLDFSETTRLNESNAFRMERLHPQTGNDSMKYHYNGISQFSSIRNRLSSHTLDRLGFKSTGTNLNLRYQNNTLLMDSLFGITYNISKEGINKFGFDKVDIGNELSLYHNNYATSLAFFSESPYSDIDFTVNTLDNQKNFINQLTGLSHTYFTHLSSQLTDGATLFDNRVTAIPNQSKQLLVTYQVSVPADTQLYVSMPNITFSNDNEKIVKISVDNKTTSYSTDNVYSFFDLGYYKQKRTVTVTFFFPNNTQVSFNPPHFYRLNTLAYQDAMTHLKDSNLQVKTKTNHVLVDYKISHNRSLIFTLPYDKGWQAKQNGKPLTVRPVQTGFMAVDVKKGQGTVVLTFVPQGFYLGLCLSLSGVITFIAYRYWLIKR